MSLLVRGSRKIYGCLCRLGPPVVVFVDLRDIGQCLSNRVVLTFLL